MEVGVSYDNFFWRVQNVFFCAKFMLTAFHNHG